MTMLAKTTVAFLLLAFLGAVASAAAFSRDGAIITNSGSTNTAGYQIKVWSDGAMQATAQPRRFVASVGGVAHSASVSAAVSAKFFVDLSAARAENAQGHPCMKSVSFGSRTNVSWHGWNSPDLSCPISSTALRALAADVGAITSASGVQTGPRMMHLPINEPRRIEPAPQATASP